MKSKKIVLSGLFVALGILIPMIFHTVNIAGTVFLPMHIPVLLAGIIVGPIYGAAVGILCPILSSLLTGMPPMVPVMPIMAFELCGYGVISGLLHNKFKNVFVSLLGAMVGGRLIAIVGAYIVSLTIAPKISPIAYVVGGLAPAIPGMIIQIILIPVIYKIITKVNSN